MKNEKLEQYLVGLTDAEGCFMIHKKMDCQIFIIRLHKRDISILQEIKLYLNCDKVRESDKNMSDYIISNKKDLYEKILSIFETYPLLTRKLYQYEYWKDILIKRVNKEKFSRIKQQYKLTENTEKTVEEIIKLSYFDNWLIGFIQGDGSFYKRKDGNRIRPEFSIGQKYDKIILEAIRFRFEIKSKILKRKCNTIFVLQTKSKVSINTIYNFFINSEIKLKSYHLNRFNNWLN